MKILLTLAAALLLVAAIAGRPPHQDAPARPGVRVAMAGMNDALPRLVHDAVERALGLDRLSPLLTRGR
jgi:hypothetical protein